MTTATAGAPFSDANQLYSYLKSTLLSSGTLTIDSTNAGTLSSDIKALITQSALFPNAKVQLQSCTLNQPATAAGPVVATGNLFGNIFQDQPSSGTKVVVGQQTKSVTLTFYFDDNNNVQLQINARMQSGWTVGDAFPAIKSSKFGATAWGDAGFIFASADDPNNSLIKKNLNFSSKLPSGNLLFMPVEALYTTGYDNVYLQGPIDLATGITQTPKMSLATDASQTDTKIGSVEVAAALNVTVANTSASQADMTLNGALVLPEGVGKLDLQATLDGANSVTFTTALAPGAINMSGLSALNGLSSGPVFGSMIPSSFAFSSDVSLGYFSLTLSRKLFSTTPTISKVAIGITYEADPPWQIFPDVIDIEKLSIEFGIASPLSSPSISATLGAGFGVGTNGELDVSVQLPDLMVMGGLPLNPAKTIDLSDIIEQLFKGTPNPAQPTSGSDIVIDQLTFTANPKEHTYRFKGDISTKLNVPGLPKGDIELDGVSWTVEKDPTSDNFYFAAKTKLLQLPIVLTAQKAGPSGTPWTFGAYLTQATPFITIVDDLLPSEWHIDTSKLDPNLNNLSITNLGATLTPQYGDYSFVAGFDWPFKIGSDTYDVSAQIQLQKSGGTSATAQKTTSGQIEGDINFNGIAMALIYKFAPQATEVIFRYNQLSVTYAPDHKTTAGHPDPTLTVAFGDATLGDLINYMVELADHGAKITFPSPWDKLFDIQLNGLSIIIHTKTKEISVRYMHDFNFAFIDFQGFEIDYSKQYGKGKVTMKVFGNFFGTEYGPDNPISWDPMNESPPSATPGSKLLDISYVGLGQHVTLAQEPAPTVEGVIKQMKQSLMPPKNPAQNPVTAMPDIVFDASSNWMIGTQFIADNAFQISAVFNDPEVYGLLVEGWGKNAGVLQGLKFEILYRKISDDLGQYHIDFLLPTEFRNIQLLEVDIVLPEVIIDIFTNGNFKINAGFPPSITQLSKSFSVQVFPFAGFGGFYFGYLNGQTSHSVPTITNGKFDPVIEIGLMLSIGLGKTISIGPMSGGAYIGVIGELQGTFATFYPTDTQSDTARYIDIIGTAGVTGKVYGKVNFVIVQASISLEVFADITLEIQSHEPIQIDMEAGVRVAVSVKVLFIHIHFHFSATIHESFTIGHQSKTPWIVAQDSRGSHLFTPNAKARALGATKTSRAALLKDHIGLVSHHMVGAGPLGIRPQPAQFNHKRAHRILGPGHLLNALKAEHPATLVARGKHTHHLPSRFERLGVYSSLKMEPKDVLGATPTTLDVWITPSITQAEKGDIILDNTGTPTTTAALLPILLMETSANNSAQTVRELVKGTGTPAAFDTLMEAMFKWALSDILESGNVSVLGLMDLKYLLNDPNQVNDTFSFSKLSSFFTQSKITFNFVENPATSTDQKSAALFPVPPAVVWSCNGSLVTDFSTKTSVGDDYAKAIDEFLSLLFADYANGVEKEASGAPQLNSTGGTALSFASYMFSNYFVAVLKQLVEQSIQHLNDYIYQIPAGDAATTTITDIANKWPSQEVVYKTIVGDTLISIAELAGVTPEEIVEKNPTVDFSNLTPNTSISVPMQVTPEGIVVANWDTSNLFATGIALPLSGLTHAVQKTDTLDSIAKLYPDTAGSVTPTAIADASASLDNLFQSGTSLPLGAITYTTGANDTIQILAGRFGLENAATVPLTAGLKLVGPASKNYVSIVTDSGSNSTLSKIAATLGVTTDLDVFYQEMLGGNPALAAKPSTATAFSSVSLTINGTSFIYELVVETASAIADIIKTWYPSVTDQTALDNIQKRVEAANSKLDFSQDLPVGTMLALPLPYSFESIALAFDMGWSAANPSGSVGTALSGVSGNYSSVAVLNIPEFSPTTATDNTFKNIAQAYNLTAIELANLIDGTQGIFVGQAKLQIPHIPAIDADTLVAELFAQGAYTNAGNMATRFFMHGLRLPNPADPNWQTYMVYDKAKKISEAATISTYPLYSLLGQTVEAPTTAAVKLAYGPVSTGAVDWIKFNSTSQPYTVSLSSDALAQIKSFATTSFNPDLQWFEADLGYAYVPQRYPLRHKFHWQTPVTPSGLENSSQKTSDLTLWPIPDTLVTTITEANAPIKLAVEAATRTANGSTSISQVDPAMWATMFDVAIQKMPVASGEKTPPKNSYMLAGTDHEGMARILSLLEYAQTAGNSLALHILYNPNATGTNAQGYLSGDVDAAKTEILKTNLSTLPAPGAPLAAMAAPSSYVAAITSPTDFLAYIYQASVIQNGGFYLSYFDSTGNGLPSTIFADGDTAKISILVVNNPNSSTDIQPFNNIALVNENLDNSNAHVFASVPFRQIGQSDTFTSIATALQAYGATAESLATANADVSGILMPGTSLSYNGGAAKYIQPSDTITSLMHSLSVPDISTFATTFAGTANLLKPGAFLGTQSGQLIPKATMKPGNVGFTVARTEPQVGASVANPTDAALLEALYNLFSYHVADGGGYNQSLSGLPAGPTDSEASTQGGELPVENDDGLWIYHQTINVAPFVANNVTPCSPALPDASGNPYVGINATNIATIEGVFHDIYGNTAGTAAALTPLPIPTKFTDSLIGPDAWPGASRSYAISGTSSAPVLDLYLTGSAAQYVPHKGMSVDAALKSAKADRARAAAIWYQLQNTTANVSIGDLGSVAASGSSYTVEEAAQQFLLDGAVQNYVFLSSVCSTTQPTIKGNGTDGLGTMAADYGLQASDMLIANPDISLETLFTSSAISSFAIPKYQSSGANETPLGLVGSDASKLSGFALSNPSAKLAEGVAIARPSLTVSKSDIVGMSLSDIAATYMTPLEDTVTTKNNVLVHGFAELNAGIGLNEGLMFTFHYTFVTVATGPVAFSYTTKSGDTLQDVATKIQEQVQAYTGPSSKSTTPIAPHATVSATDIAVNNTTIKSVFDGTQNVSVEALIIPAGATLLELAETCWTGSNPAAQLLTDNQNVPGVFVSGIALLVGTTAYAVQPGDTPSTLATQQRLQIGDIGTVNKDLAVQTSAELKAPYLQTSPTSYALYRPADAGKLSDVQALGTGYADLASLNGYVPGLFKPGVTLSGNGKTHTVALTDTPNKIANALGYSGATAIASFLSDVAAEPAMRAASTWMIDSMTAASTFADTIDNYWPAFGGTADKAAAVSWLAQANASIKGLLKQGSKVTFPGLTSGITLAGGETLTSLAETINSQLGKKVASPAAIVAANTNLALNPVILICAPAQARTSLAVTAQPAATHFPLQVTVSMSRDKSAVEDVFQGTDVETFTTTLTADTGSGSNADADNLKDFAKKLETAIPGLKVATGPKQVSAGAHKYMAKVADPSDKNPSIWLANFSSTLPNAYSFKSDITNSSQYAVAPIANELWNWPNLETVPYKSGTGLSGTKTINMVDGRPDQWAAELLELIDTALSPDYALAAQLTDPTTLTSLITTKSKLAEDYSKRLTPIIDGQPTTNVADAQNALYQALLVELGQAYSVESVFQLPFTGSGDANNSAALYTKPTANLVAVPTTNSIEGLSGETNLSKGYLVEVLLDRPYLVQPGVALTFKGTKYTTRTGDTLASLLTSFDGQTPTNEDLYNGNIAPVTFLKKAGNVGGSLLHTTTVAGSTLSGLAATFDLLPMDFLMANADVAMFEANQPIKTDAGDYTPTSDATPTDVASNINGISVKDLGAALWRVDIAKAGGQASAGEYTLKTSVQLSVLHLTPQMNLSSVAVPLTSSGATANYLFTVKNAAEQKSIFLNLGFDAVAMQVDIEANPEVPGYEFSEWLHFVTPITDKGTSPLAQAADIGQANLLVPLREIPGVGSLGNQQVHVDQQGASIKQLADWTYSVDLKRKIAAQDELSFTLHVDVGTSSSAMTVDTAASPNPLYVPLANFHFATKAIAKDLSAFGDPAATSATLGNAVIALKALDTLATQFESALSTATVSLGAHEYKTPRFSASTEVQYEYSMTPIASESDPDELAHLLVTMPTSSPQRFALDIPSNDLSGDGATLTSGNLPSKWVNDFGARGYTLETKPTITQLSGSNSWEIIDNTNNQTYIVTTATSPISAFIISQKYFWPSVTVAQGPVSEEHTQGLGEGKAHPKLVEAAGAKELKVRKRIHDASWHLEEPQTGKRWLLCKETGPDGLTQHALHKVLNAGTGAKKAYQLGNSLLLPLETGQGQSAPQIGSMMELRFDFENLMVLSEQNASSSCSVTRNKNLAGDKGKTTTAAFVYQSDPAEVPNPLSAEVVRTKVIDISSSGTTLDAALKSFFTEDLFQALQIQDDSAKRYVTISGHYLSDLYGQGGAPLLQTPFPLTISSSFEYAVNSQGQFASDFGDALKGYAGTVGAPTSSGGYMMEIQVFTDIGGLPGDLLLQLNQVYFKLS